MRNYMLLYRQVPFIKQSVYWLSVSRSQKCLFFFVGLHVNFLQFRYYIAQPADLIEEICTIKMINFSCHLS